MRNAVQALLVVLILVVLGLMIVPFLVQVRAAAARAQCTNNLRLLGLATVNYHDTCNTFPKAALPNPDLPPEKRQSWVVAIWPFVEAGPIYNKMDHKKAWDAEENRFVALTTLFCLQCPGYPERPPNTTFFSSHYLGVAGIGADAIQLPLEDRRAGIFGYDRSVKQDDLKRGASETVLFVETSHARGAWTAAGAPTTRGLVPDGPAYFGAAGPFDGNHRHGTNTAFADGSVRFLEQTIAPAVWEAMATLSGKGNRE